MNNTASGLAPGSDGRMRCAWCVGDPLYEHYHDTEWGRPVSEDRRLFEKACLEGFQSGLSWLTILRKRENFRAAFDGFDIRTVSRFGDHDIERLLQDAGIVRHRGKIEAAISNAERALDLQRELGSLAAFFWSHEPPASARLDPVTWSWITANPTTAESTTVSKALKTRGWRFVGPTTMYALFQAMGVVNDHVEGCAFRQEVEDERRAFERPVRA